MRFSAFTSFLAAILTAAGAAAGDFQFEELRRLAERPEVDDLETLVALLPADLRSSYTLIFSSRSLQGASFENPRAVLFGTTGRLVVTFNGAAEQRGFAALETMEFEPQTDTFVFREIAFAAGGRASISEPNPARCTVCHGREPRPIWDSWPAWPGAYGERADSGLSPVEAQGMRRFLARQPQHPRYRWLIDAPAHGSREFYAGSARATYDGAVSESPNARLSRLLASLNVRDILTGLAKRPGFAAHLPAMVAAAESYCGPPADYYPETEQSVVNEDFKRFAARTATADRLQRLSKRSRQTAGPAASRTPGGGPQGFTALRYVAASGLGIDTAHWTLAFERESSDLASPEGSLTLERALSAWLERSDPGLARLEAYRSFGPEDAVCRHLRESSRNSLLEWYRSHPEEAPTARLRPAPAPADAAGAAPAMLGACAACHTGDVAPALPFGDAASLAGRLREEGYPRGRLIDEILFRLQPGSGDARMPRGRAMSEAEQAGLESYFLRLAGGT